MSKRTVWQMENGNWIKTHMEIADDPAPVVTPAKRAEWKLHDGAWNDYRIARREAKRLANLIGADLQDTDNELHVRVIKGGAIRDFGTWLKAATWMERIAKDMYAEKPP